MKAYILTRHWHHDGMDTAVNKIEGVYSTLEEAQRWALLEDCQYWRIANPCEIEEVEIGAPLDVDEERVIDCIRQFPHLQTPELEAVLDVEIPTWREQLSILQRR